MKTPCTKWLDTLSDAQLDGHSQSTLANEAWKRGAAYAAQRILDHIEEIDTVAMATEWREEDAGSVGNARVQADKFIKRVNKALTPKEKAARTRARIDLSAWSTKR